MSHQNQELFPLAAIQPSQFYISQEKLAKVLEWFNPENLSNFDPVPLKRLNGEVIFTDGHTRAAAAFMSGLSDIPFIWDNDDLDWKAYMCCVDACKERGIYTIEDLSKGIVSQADYETLWYGWCDALHEALQKEREQR